jgi:hypothetical protein
LLVILLQTRADLRIPAFKSASPALFSLRFATFPVRLVRHGAHNNPLWVNSPKHACQFLARMLPHCPIAFRLGSIEKALMAAGAVPNGWPPARTEAPHPCPLHAGFIREWKPRQLTPFAVLVRVWFQRPAGPRRGVPGSGEEPLIPGAPVLASRLLGK